MKISNGKLVTPSCHSRAELSTVARPTRNTKILWVEKLKGNDVQKFVVVTPVLHGFYSHYVEGRRPPSAPCWKDHTLCEGGHKEDNRRENFFLHCWSYRANKSVWLYLTPGAAQQLEDLVHLDLQQLKGLTLSVSRTSANNGRLNVHIDEHIEVRKVFEANLDPWESILAYLKVPESVRREMRQLAPTSRPIFDRG